jgi:hypothetical protein
MLTSTLTLKRWPLLSLDGLGHSMGHSAAWWLQLPATQKYNGGKKQIICFWTSRIAVLHVCNIYRDQDVPRSSVISRGFVCPWWHALSWIITAASSVYRQLRKVYLCKRGQVYRTSSVTTIAIMYFTAYNLPVLPTCIIGGFPICYNTSLDFLTWSNSDPRNVKPCACFLLRD